MFLWLVARACIQSITIDEADTYVAFVGRSYPSYWEAAANNHVLNSLLMRLSTTLFGASHLAMRLPALLGAAVYIAAALSLVNRIPAGKALRWFLLITLTCNPFVMDHLVAARGYSLGLGFLLATVALAAAPGGAPAALYRRCALCSLSSALSVCANFSFAIVNGAALFLISLWLGRRAAMRYATPHPTLKICAAVFLAATLPGALIAVPIAGSVLLEWSKGGDLVWGAASLQETLWSAGQASLFQPNPFILNPPLYKIAMRCGAAMFPLLGIACALRFFCLAFEYRKLANRRARFSVAIAGIAAGAAALALCVHYILFRKLHLLLPLDRTAVYLAPLVFLAAGALAATPLNSRSGRFSHRVSVAALAAFSLYFLCCLRLTYFRTWQFDADAKQLYSVLAAYGRKHPLAEISANWRYVAVLNFYRAASGDDAVPEIPGAPAVLAEYPPGKQMYVLFLPADRPFVDRERLTLIYQDAESGAAVAVPAALAPQRHR